MERIIPTNKLPQTMPADICIKFASKYFSIAKEDRINDISETGILTRKLQSFAVMDSQSS